jgi:hypothetical protein
VTFPFYALWHATCKSSFIISWSDSLTHLDSVRGDQIASRRPSESIMQVPAGVVYQECPNLIMLCFWNWLLLHRRILKTNLEDRKKLIPWGWALLEKGPLAPATQEFLKIFYRTRRFITMFTIVLHWPEPHKFTPYQPILFIDSRR